MTRKSTAGRLPRLTPPGDREASPRDLRGDRYSKLNNTQRKDRVVMLPELKGGEDHPAPYYVSDGVTFPALTNTPWKEDEKKDMKEKLEQFGRDSSAQGLLVDSLLDDVLNEEIVASASVAIEQEKYQEKEDYRAAEVMEEEIMMPGVQREVWVIVWSLLYDLGRSLPQHQYQELQERQDQLQLDPITKHALLAHVLEGENWESDLKEERILSGVAWDALVYNYHRNLLENGLAKNMALQIYQERVVSAAGGREVVAETVSALEEYLTQQDQREKVDSPPRQG
ncbi:hypothetical protein Pmani_010120 [Petrolisthes manimaculis]|uniref:Uncharacterized protein n=1 Tax=Petrolisthes manimaculis TaxID=1843537 RepID=A0AAE1Q543_9EUCA|nr:hypothetical protein Pmani_010120 [Petrolisthes manimaculis]